MAGNSEAPGLTSLLGRIAVTGLGAVRNRAELLAVEWYEERTRLIELLVWGYGFLFLVMMTAILLTATIVFLVPTEWRIYVVAGFAFLYLAGAVLAFLGVKKLIKRQPFADTLDQAKKDREWLESLK